MLGVGVDAARITVVDQKPYLLFVPNIPLEVLANRDPALSLHLQLPDILQRDDIDFAQARVLAIDPEQRGVTIVPSERPGAAPETLHYDYLVVALGARLAFEAIPGFAAHGHTVSDTYYGNKLRQYLHGGGYRGGPIAVGSARFHQGHADNLVPQAAAACEGPVVEMALSLGTWLRHRGRGGPQKVTLFTPAELIAEDAGTQVVHRLLELASGMGYHYRNNVQDVVRLTADGVEFADGTSLEAEIKIVFPDWVPHDFLRDLPISDDRGFVITDRFMRNPRYGNVFAVGDAAALSVPKIGSIAHEQGGVVARQIAKDLGLVTAEVADIPAHLKVFCIGDMGDGEAFYIDSDSWYGGPKQELRTGRLPAVLKTRYKDLFFQLHGKVPAWTMQATEWLAEHL
jgi:sulfide:quinone oxidoreductase